MATEGDGAVVTAPKRTCPTCGFKVRGWKDEKRCPGCNLVKPVQEWPHARSRPGHTDSLCTSCKRERQRTSYRKEKLEARLRHFPDKPGQVTPLAELNPVVDGYLVGRVKSKRRLAEYESEPSRQPVYRLRLVDAITNAGATLPQVDVIHTSETVAVAHLTPGEWLGLVFDDGWLAKLVRLDPPDGAGSDAILDEALVTFEVPDSPLGGVGILPRSYSPARPWVFEAAMKTILGYAPAGSTCPFCQVADAELTDITLRCSTCTNGLEWAADRQHRRSARGPPR